MPWGSNAGDVTVICGNCVLVVGEEVLLLARREHDRA